MNYKFSLLVEAGENEDEIIRLETYSLESLEEQLHKVEKAIKRYEAKQEDKEYEEFENWKETHDCNGDILTA